MKRTAFLRKPPDAARLMVTVTTLRSRKCRICFTRFTPDRKNVVWCGPECAVLVAKEAVEKQAREKEKAVRVADRAKREALKPRSKWLSEAQAAFNAYVRARDAHQPCICCGRTSEKQYLTGTNWDSGHYRSVGSAPHLRFHEDNVHRQLVYCNRHGAGRAVDYRIGLIARIGLAAVEALEADQTPRKWTVEELQQIKATYREKLRKLTKEKSCSENC